MEIDYNTLPKRDLLFIDVKSYFASIEAVRRRIHPLHAYVIVVANKERPGSVILASSPRVKQELGISTGSRNWEINRNDPRLIIVEPSMGLYLKVNKMIVDIVKRFVADEDLHIYSIDEMVIDTTFVTKLHGDKFEIARKIQQTIFKELRLVVTIGIGDNPLLAKLALDNEAKKAPNGMAYWSYENIPETIWRIPKLTDMWGISYGYEERLKRMGIESVYDLAHADKNKLKDRFGIMGLQLFFHSWGVDYTILSERDSLPNGEKSFSKGQVLMRDYYKENEITIVIKEMVDEVSSRLRKHGVAAAKIALTVSYSRDIEERGFNKQMQLPKNTNHTMELTRHFIQIFRQHWQGQPVRQIYVSCGKLRKFEYEQLDLFTTADVMEKSHAIDTVMDELRSRYGKDAIFKAYNLMKGGTYLSRANHIGGHKG
ncbi:UV-damage repair protein uvrX [Bacillus sp. 37MA]|uniref:Y-family DNA polymerase n=1 Tax=Bacillus sp. 37MA TaxID=1132442 RepID=UPI00037095FE|nr:UV-damage repair protein uvrX [Bacillus sp. 37MA]